MKVMSSSAADYVRLAEDRSGPIPRQADFSYIWGAALAELRSLRPDARIINLETSITHGEAYEPKGINYRMSPENADCLAAAGIDCCVLANNHVRDWGQAGLLDTLATLEQLRIRSVGAGRSSVDASAPAILEIPGKGRVLVSAFASTTSGVPPLWAARRDAAGLNLLPDLSSATVAEIADRIDQVRQPRDVVIISLHWGPNWGYEIPEEQRRFAHELIDKAGISVVYGHSSHHAKSIEVYRNRLILYGCGDFLNDYEGIRGYERFRGDLVLMYFVEIDPVGAHLVALNLVPLQIRRFQLIRAAKADGDWLLQTLSRESRMFGTCFESRPDGKLALSLPERVVASLATGSGD